MAFSVKTSEDILKSPKIPINRLAEAVRKAWSRPYRPLPRKADVGGIMRIALLHPHELHDVNPATVIFSLGDSAGRETLCEQLSGCLAFLHGAKFWKSSSSSAHLAAHLASCDAERKPRGEAHVGIQGGAPPGDVSLIGMDVFGAVWHRHHRRRAQRLSGAGLAAANELLGSVGLRGRKWW